MRPQTIVERLDFVAKRIPGLKFTGPTQLKPGDDQGCFMSCDMFYIEIKVDPSHQSVKDVVISHGNNSEISCPVLRKVLGDQDFETFAKHLSGLHAIYRIDTKDKKVKQRAYPALTALETDLTILYDHQRQRVTNCHDLVHKSPLGIMEPRKCGLPVRLTYFVTPFDLVDTATKGLISLSINNIIEKNLGLSATVEIESSGLHKLQIRSLLSTQLNSSLPLYAPFNSQNSEKLPAQFVLNLSQPLPILNTSIIQMMNELINEPATIKDYLNTIVAKSKESLVSLIARQELDLNKGPFCRSVDTLRGADSNSCDLEKHVYSIKLLDQCHTYYVLDNYLERQDGAYLTKIPFTHPTSIPSILKILRQQAQFNCLIGSCIRRNKSDNNLFYEIPSLPNESSIFDIIPVSLNNLCISFEHPSKESIATLEIDLFKDLSCHLYALDKESVCSNEFATKVLQKCWSIPITLRSVLKKCDARRLALLEDATKRREREVQELLTNNSTQQGLKFKPPLQFSETIMQNKFDGLNQKSNSRDLNSIAEFLSSKINNASTSDASNQTITNIEKVSNRSNVIEKFSCKPKAKQNTTTKNQPVSKILSSMLKRPNSSIDDPSFKVTKKAKTKHSVYESSAESSLGGVTSNKLVLKLTVAKPKPVPVASSSAASPATSTLSSGLESKLNIKYTIPKISKSQQGDDANKPSSSAASSAAPSSTTAKRTSSSPFNRLNNKNSVSSSTHPPPSNSLAIVSRPSSTTVQLNSISSTNPSHLTSSTPANGPSGNQGVSSTSDASNHTTISTPSSPTECGQQESAPPPPLIPIDSLDEPQPTSPETDHPDDASDRLSIVDTNENVTDSNSTAGTPKSSVVE